jgi:hypothetical protein
MDQREISPNLAVRSEDGDTFIVGRPDEVYVDEDAGGRGMIKIRQEDIRPLIECLKTMLLVPNE